MSGYERAKCNSFDLYFRSTQDRCRERPPKRNTEMQPVHARMASAKINIQLELKLTRDEGQQGRTPASAAEGRLRKCSLCSAGQGPSNKGHGKG